MRHSPGKSQFILILLLGLSPVLDAFAQAQPGGQAGDQYSELFESLQPGLFTVEVVHRASNNKNAQGSAFLVSDSGVLATNYHVVSEYILEPEQFSLRYRDAQGETGPLKVVDIDVLHDLALVRFAGEASQQASSPFALAESIPLMGETILALGNPYDIGISIVPGTYNGLLENQYRKNIHFTGALNPGMSGGPAVNTEGRVVGINVAGAGNSVSFLVPVVELRRLLAAASDRPASLQTMRDRVVERIIEHQSDMFDDLIDGDWSLEAFGPLMIPREIQPWLSCSGSGNESDAQTPWRESHSNCTLNDRIYLSRSLDTGPVEIIVSWFKSDELNQFQFARVLEQNTFVPSNRTGNDDVTAFECRENWVAIENLAPVNFKASYCLRTYLDYPGLYDVLYIARALMPDSEAVNIHYTLAGVGYTKALEFHRHLLEALTWK